MKTTTKRPVTSFDEMTDLRTLLNKRRRGLTIELSNNQSLAIDYRKSIMNEIDCIDDTLDCLARNEKR